MTIAKTICAVIALILFALEAFNVHLGTINNIPAGLFFLTIAVAPISI
jgi:hypothetical protein